MFFSAAVFALVVAAPPVEVTASVRTDARAGVAPTATAVVEAAPGEEAGLVLPASPTAEIVITPSLAGVVSVFGMTGRARYAPTLQWRTQLPFDSFVLGQHAVEVSLNGGDEVRNAAVGVQASASAGRQDVGTASRLLGQSAGNLGNTVSLASSNLGIYAQKRLVPRLALYASSALGLFALPGAPSTATGVDLTAYLLVPDFSTLIPAGRVDVAAGTLLQVFPRLELDLGVRAEAVGRTDPLGYAGTTLRAEARYQASRTLSVVGEGGVLLGAEAHTHLDPPRWRGVVLPVASVSVEGSVPYRRFLHGVYTVGAGLTPTYDLFLARVTSRVTAHATGGLVVNRTFAVTGALRSWTLLPDFAFGPELPQTGETPATHIATADVALLWSLREWLRLGAGLTGFVRVTPAIPTKSDDVLPETLVYVSAELSFATRL